MLLGSNLIMTYGFATINIIADMQIFDDDMSGRGVLRRWQGDKNHRFLTKCRKTLAKMYRIEQREQRF